MLWHGGFVQNISKSLDEIRVVLYNKVYNELLKGYGI